MVRFVIGIYLYAYFVLIFVCLILNLKILILQFKYSLYVEVKRTSQDSPLEEFDGEKRLWWKVDDIDGDLYHQHYVPTQFNTDMKILSTEQYIPPFLKFFCGSTGEYLINITVLANIFFYIYYVYIFKDEEHHDHEYVQDKPIIERPLAFTPKRTNPSKTNTSGDDDMIQIDEKIATSSELNGEGIIPEQKETINSMASEFGDLKRKYEEAIQKLNEKENQIERLKKNDEKSQEELKEKENEIKKLEKKYKDAIEKRNENSRKLEQIDTKFFGPIDTDFDLSEEEKLTLQECCEFIKLNSTIRASLTTRNKSIQRKIIAIEKIATFSKEVIFRRG